MTRYIPYGLANPKSDIPCGIEEYSLLPVPVHYDCSRCKDKVIEYLLSRIVQRTECNQVFQTTFFGVYW